MTTKITNTTITFNDNTTQTTRGITNGNNIVSGAGGIGFFVRNTNGNLEFKQITAGTGGYVTITGNANTVTITGL